MLAAFIALSISLGQATLQGISILPADTFADGPPSGQFDGQGQRAEAPRFPSQPVQGFSAVQAGAVEGEFLFLSDNGFGTQAASPDYLLRIYRIAAKPGEAPRVLGFIPLRDPEKKMPYRIVNEFSEERLLTGADFDLESFVIAEDGTLWLGDEFGPFLLHFSAEGALLEAPVPVPLEIGGRKEVRSPQNPAIVAQGVQPGDPVPANLPSSGGFEGMAISPDKATLHPLLEKTVAGDDPRLLRLFSFDLQKKEWGGFVFYPREEGGEAIGDMATIDAHRYLVIERDNKHGPAAKFKKVFQIDLREKDESGILKKREIADLMSIANPQKLAGFDTPFTFPYLTIECALMLSPDTLLIANDNNFPATGARKDGQRDNTEILWLKLDKPL